MKSATVASGVDAGELWGDEDNDLMVSGRVANELSNRAGDANDLALAALLFNWGTTGSDRTGLAAITHDGLRDVLYGNLGNDDFGVEDVDLSRDFDPATDEKF